MELSSYVREISKKSWTMILLTIVGDLLKSIIRATPEVHSIYQDYKGEQEETAVENNRFVTLEQMCRCRF